MSVLIPNRIDKCRGSMLATAIGDALGWPNEKRAKNKNRGTKSNDYFIEWTRRNSKPCYHDEEILPGEYSDDTQLTLSVARSIITGDWEDFFANKELPYWLNYERGGGKALLKAAQSYKDGIIPWQSKFARDYFYAGGNGAVMRVLPHVISNAKKSDIANLMVDIIKNSIITHGHPRAILGATCYAFALVYLLKKETVLEYGELVSAVIDGQKVWGAYLRNDEFENWLKIANHYFDYASEWNRVYSDMINQLEYIRVSLKKGLILDDIDVLTHLGCFSQADGAGDVAILAAIYLASRYANNPVLGIKIPASSFGADTDTIASITGGLLGMLCGTNWIPVEWKSIQDYECFIRITDMLLADDSKQAAKMELTEVRAQASDWIAGDIGRIRKVGTTTIQSGNYAIVTITKWQSALGQTFYMKEMQKLTSQSPSLYKEEVRQNLQQTYPLKVQSVKPDYITEIIKTSPIQYTEVQQFILNKDNIVELLTNSQFKMNVTIGKVLKIIQALIENHKSSMAIAKQFKVEQAMVDMLKTYIKK